MSVQHWILNSCVYDHWALERDIYIKGINISHLRAGKYTD